MTFIDSGARSAALPPRVAASRRAACARVALAAACASAPAVAAASDGLAGSGKPLWELGVGVGALRLPHYRGSDQSHTLVLPVPYFVYRGPILKADRSGARARLFESDRVDFDLSLSASPPTDGDTRARDGMDDLSPTVEIGPNLSLTLARGDGWKLDLRVPVRAAITVESRPRAIGWTSAPVINLDVASFHGWQLGLLAGPEFGTRRFHGYFYDVPASDATASRPAYRAPGGFAGGKITAALSRRFDNAWAGMFLKIDTLNGARFEDSPLVRRKTAVSFGVAVAWVLSSSSRRVTGED